MAAWTGGQDTIEAAFAADERLTALQPALPRFLAGRRWFAGKARTVVGAGIEDTATFAVATGVTLVLVRVEYAEGAPERYALLVATVAAPGDLPVIARLPPGDGGTPRVLVEVGAAPFAIAALAASFAAAPSAGASVPTRGRGRLEYAAVRPATVTADDVATAGIRPLGAEQSNSSARLGTRLLLKLFRVLADGENPEVEVGRCLTAAGFRATPALRGAITYHPRGGEPSTIAVLQEWRDNAGDGWSHMVAALRTGPVDVAALRHDAAALGATTAEMHAALASAAADRAFAPEPAEARDVTAWTAAVGARAARLAARLGAATATLVPDARALLADLGDVVAAARRLAAAPGLAATGGFAKIRIHGDYHLGQTLRVPDGFLVIDFEGEPARPLVERRAKHCALKDVAGMLRSFAYAIAVASGAGAEGCGAAAPAAAWTDVEDALRDAFLTGYLAAAGDAAFLPKDPDARRALLDVFELEKALYEVEYELDHRPSWTPIPLRGVARLTRSGRPPR